jgi:hypothetical protein
MVQRYRRIQFRRAKVEVVAYDWSQVRAELLSMRGVNGQGGFVATTSTGLAIVAPGTNKVIDRFPLRMIEGRSVWSYACTYMQHGLEALPPTTNPAPDPNDAPPYNLALLLAPKVKWPADVDAKSRSAP